MDIEAVLRQTVGVCFFKSIPVIAELAAADEVVIDG